MSQRKLSIEYGLLGFVRQQPMHGYAIHQALSDPSGLGSVWQIKLGRLYALLGKLEDAGFISTTLEPQGNKPPRKLFHLTEQGETAFLAWVEAPVRHGRSLRLEFLVKLFFAGRENPELSSRLLGNQRRQCRQWLHTEEERMEGEMAPAKQFDRLVHQFRAGQIGAMLDWLDACEIEIKRVF